MSEFQDSANVHTIGAPRWVGLAVAVLGGISLISLGVGWSALNQARNVEQSTQATVKQTNEAVALCHPSSAPILRSKGESRLFGR